MENNENKKVLLSLKDVDGLNFEEADGMLAGTLANICMKYEDYYHAFLAGIFVGRGYEVESNKEKGLGRPDILLKDRKNRRAIIIESKKSKRKASLGRDCDEAIKQIIDERYAEGIEGYEQILCYGVAFFQKDIGILNKP